MSGMSTLLSLCIVERHPMSGKSTLLLLLYCRKTKNIKKVYIVITFVLWKEIQCHENLHCYQFCIVERHPMSGKSTLLSYLYCCAKTSNIRNVTLLSPLFYSLPTKSFNTRKIHIAITFMLCEDIQYQEVYIATTFNCAETSNERKVYSSITFES